MQFNKAHADIGFVSGLNNNVLLLRGWNKNLMLVPNTSFLTGVAPAPQHYAKIT
jgi:hypothetical protein